MSYNVQLSMSTIPVRITSRKASPKFRARYNSVLVEVQMCVTKDTEASYPPSILLSNVRSIRYKIDELTLLANQI